MASSLIKSSSSQWVAPARDLHFWRPWARYSMEEGRTYAVAMVAASPFPGNYGSLGAGSAKGVTHMRDALIVADHDWKKMGSAILILLRDRDLACRLGTNERKTALDRLDWKILRADLEEICTGLDKGLRSAPERLA